MQTRSVPLQVPLSVHLLAVEPDAGDPFLQENLQTVSYNICVVSQPNSTPLVGVDKVGHVTATQKKKCFSKVYLSKEEISGRYVDLFSGL